MHVQAAKALFDFIMHKAYSMVGAGELVNLQVIITSTSRIHYY